MHKCKPLKWLWGIIPLLLIGFIAAYGQRGAIERDLQQRTNEALQKAGLNWAELSFEGRDGIIRGTAGQKLEREQALDIAANVKGVRIIADNAELLAVVSPYNWFASLHENRIKIWGHAPSERDRKTIIGIARAKFPDFEIDDRMNLGGGAPKRETWLAGISLGLNQLSQLKDSRVSLSDNVYSVTGEAKNRGSYKTVLRELNNGLPKGIKLGKAEITPPVANPFRWQALYDNKSVKLSGFAPSEALRSRIYNFATDKFSQKAIIDNTEIASGAPQGWADAVELSLMQLAKLNAGKVEIINNKLKIDGEAQDEETALTVSKTVRTGLPAIFRSTEKISFVKPAAPVIPQISPYKFVAERAGNQITLSGYVASEAARKNILARAGEKNNGAEIADALKLGLGGPGAPAWGQILNYSIDQLAYLQNGRITVTDSAWSIAGTARSEQAYKMAKDALKSLPAGFIVAQDAIEPPAVSNYFWQAQSDGKTITLSGYVPNRSARQALLSFVSKTFPNITVIDEMKLASGAPQGWGEATQVGLISLGELESGTAYLTGEALRITGEAKDNDSAIAVRKGLKDHLPGRYKTIEALSVKTAPKPPQQPKQPQQSKQTENKTKTQKAAPKSSASSDGKAAGKQQKNAAPNNQASANNQASLSTARSQNNSKKGAQGKSCESLLNSTAARGKILFPVISWTLKASSYDVLRELARIARKCPSAQIEIAGHADSDGSKIFNKFLSRKRAESVASFLAKSGINRQRLNATGYGEDRPAAPNTSDANKALNRRIEFIVK